jgi:hypothetical protein
MLRAGASAVFHRQKATTVTDNLYSKSKSSQHSEPMSTKFDRPVGVPHPSFAMIAKEDGDFDFADVDT